MSEDPQKPEQDEPEQDKPEQDRPEQDRPEQDRPEQDRPEKQQTEQRKQAQQKQLEAHNRATTAFIDLANKLAKEEGQDVKIVSAALMAASGIYATFIAAGNNGFLAPSGVDKIAQMYKNNLGYVQKRKQEELKAKGIEPKPLGTDTKGNIAAPHAEKIRQAEENKGNE